MTKSSGLRKGLTVKLGLYWVRELGGEGVRGLKIVNGKVWCEGEYEDSRG